MYYDTITFANCENTTSTTTPQTSTTTSTTTTPTTTTSTTTCPVVPVPTFDPVNGSTVTFPVEVTIDGDGTIFYTLDGSTPTADSTPYSGPVEVAEGQTIKAIVIAEGGCISNVSAATYIAATTTTTTPTSTTTTPTTTTTTTTSAYTLFSPTNLVSNSSNPAFLTSATAGDTGDFNGRAWALFGAGTDYTTNGISNPFPAIWKVQMTVGVACVRYTLQAEAIGCFPAAMPKDWFFEGSNDGSSWATLDSQSGITSWSASEIKIFTFANVTAFTYYRLRITAGNAGCSGYALDIFKLKLYKTP